MFDKCVFSVVPESYLDPKEAELFLTKLSSKCQNLYANNQLESSLGLQTLNSVACILNYLKWTLKVNAIESISYSSHQNSLKVKLFLNEKGETKNYMVLSPEARKSLEISQSGVFINF